MHDPEQNPIEPQGDHRYAEGAAWHIPFESLQQFDSEYEPWEEPENAQPTDLTDAQEIEFYVKEELTDYDSEALLEKTLTGSGADDGDTDGDIDITEPEMGRYRVHIQSGDTKGFLDTTDPETGEQTRKESEEFYWAVWVTDADGNRVCDETGVWEMHAA